MKKFLIQLAFFLLPILLLAYFADIFISKNLKKSNTHAQDEYSTWNAIIDGKVNANIVIYGSSRAWKHIDATMITDSLHVPAYNMGIDGHSFWLQYLRHTLLLEKNTPPKLIIHSVDILTLQKKKELYNQDQFLPYMLWNNEIKNATVSYEGFRPMDYEVPLLRYYGKYEAIKSAFRSFIHPINKKKGRVKGFAGKDQSWNGDFDKAKKERKSYDVVVDSPTVVLFEKYLKECKAKNINMIFVYTPEYIDGQKFTSNRDQIIGIFTKFSQQYNIPFYDYSLDSMSFQKKYFYNASHLNKTGAEIFTSNLMARIRNTDALKGISK